MMIFEFFKTRKWRDEKSYLFARRVSTAGFSLLFCHHKENDETNDRYQNHEGNYHYDDDTNSCQCSDLRKKRKEWGKVQNNEAQTLISFCINFIQDEKIVHIRDSQYITNSMIVWKDSPHGHRIRLANRQSICMPAKFRSCSRCKKLRNGRSRCKWYFPGKEEHAINFIKECVISYL